MASRLFSPIRLRALELPNRIVVSPMCQYSAADGCATDWHLVHLGQMSMSGSGLVIVEATAVERRGRITHRCLGLYSDESEAALARVLAFCRRHGSARLGIQLAHAGRKASAHPPSEGRHALAPHEDAWETVAPSPLPVGPSWPVPSALDRAGMERVREAFVASALRAQRLGFDLIELHFAHGYLMHEFLSPLTNRRDDDYGGPLENRMRLPLEIFEAVRRVWPEERPLGVRVSASDWIDGGWTIEDSVALSRALKERGCDYVCASSGGGSTDQNISLGPGYQVPFASEIRRGSGIATMAVGMILEPEHAEAIVTGGEADMIALARGMLYDPRWPWHAAEALGAKAAYPVQYERSRPANWPQAFASRKAAE